MEKDLKDILLKDLCARLPYGVKCKILETNEVKILGSIQYDDENTLFDFWEDDQKIQYGHQLYLSEFKPYLFPLSSMTEKQRNDISKLLIDTQKEYSPYGELNMRGCDNLFICTVKQANALINYCLTHHLDINGLIEKSLALDATGLNIY